PWRRSVAISWRRSARQETRSASIVRRGTWRHPSESRSGVRRSTTPTESPTGRSRLPIEQQRAAPRPSCSGLTRLVRQGLGQTGLVGLRSSSPSRRKSPLPTHFAPLPPPLSFAVSSATVPRVTIVGSSYSSVSFAIGPSRNLGENTEPRNLG